MSESTEYKLAKKLIWSRKAYTLNEFVKNFKLPQVVLIHAGYCGVDERTTFSRDQILTLHQVRTTKKVVCDVANRNTILLPTSCDRKAELLQLDCNDITAQQLSKNKKNIKYVRVLETGFSNSIGLLKRNDIIEIQKINSQKLGCRNLTSKQNIIIPTTHPGIFVPLLHPNQYTLAEIKKKYGFPAMIRFVDNKMTPVPSGLSQSSAGLCHMGKMLAIEEVQQNDVIATTVCSDLKEKVCCNIPTSLDIKITVAEGFLRGDETYATIVDTLDKTVNQTDLKAFEDLDVYQHMDAVKKGIKNWDQTFNIEEASSEIIVHARNTMRAFMEGKSEKAGKHQFSSIYETTATSMPTMVRNPQYTMTSEYNYAYVDELKQVITDDDNYTYLEPNVLSPNNHKYHVLTQDSGEPSANEIKQNAVISQRSSKDLANSMSIPSVENRDNNSINRRSFSEGIYAETDFGDSGNYTCLQRHLNASSADTYTYQPLRPGKHKAHSVSSIQDIPLPPIPLNPSSPRMPKYPPPSKPMKDEREAISLVPPPVPIKPQLSNRKKDEREAISLAPPPVSIKPQLSNQTKDEREEIYEAISRYPQDLTTLTVTDVSQLLKYLGMQDHVASFEEELIDGSMLITMDKESLQFLNVNTFYCNKLLRFIGGWRPKVGKSFI